MLQKGYSHQVKESGRTRRLSPSNMLLATLLFLRQYPTHLFLAYMFHVSRPTISRTISFVMDCLYDFFRGTLVLPPRAIRDRESKILRGRRVSVVIDGTEQRVCKSQFKDVEQAFYSGKKKSHTLTTLLAVSPTGFIYFLSGSYFGSLNDLNVAMLPENQVFKSLEPDEGICADGGYKGMSRFHPNTFIPIVKTARQPELSPEETAFNNELASIRVVVENSIGHIKKWKCCYLPFRYDDIADIHEIRKQHHRMWYVCASFTHLTVFPLR